MATVEYKIQAIAKLILETALTGVTVSHWVKDGNTVSEGNRITVRAEPPTVKLGGCNPMKKAPVWQSVVTVEMQNGANTYEAWKAAIDTAMNPPTGTAYPAPVITLAGHATDGFPNGIVIENASGGSEFSGPSDRREYTRTYPVIFQT